MRNTPEDTHSEQPAIQLFQKMGYEYYNAQKQDEREDITEIVLKDRLRAAIPKAQPMDK